MSWTIKLNDQWDVLGPFPIHAREQHYLSPAFPLNLSQSIDFSRQWTSSYADGGLVGWSKTTMSQQGFIDITFPEIRWATLRATEGWAALQHHVIIRTTLTIYPPLSSTASSLPKLLVDLNRGSYFTIRPQKCDIAAFVPEWFAGNIYDMEGATPHAVALPSDLCVTEPIELDLFVSGDYEIRLFGDPLTNSSQCPVQHLSINVSILNDEHSIQHQPCQDVVCDIVAGYAFGDCIGIAMQNLSDSWWTVSEVRGTAREIQLTLSKRTVIAPTQTRLIPIIISQQGPYPGEFIWLDVVLQSADNSKVIPVSLPVKHYKSLDQRASIRASYLNAGSTPTAFLASPPRCLGNTRSKYPMLALHGAGVDILTQEFWTRSLPNNKYGWTVVPTGRTSWGLDWHGSSAKDAWASLEALRRILVKLPFAEPFQIPPDYKVILVGHSNGGQGAWYLASRFPDRVLATVAAAAYIKSQSYIPLTLSRSAHFMDPSLRSILESSFTSDDNDLHLSNLIDIPVLGIHGGEDDNVPVWHTREAMSVLKCLYPTKEIFFKEDPGKGHWYPDVLNNPTTQAFLDKVVSDEVDLGTEFTLTVTSPHESGSLRNFRVRRLKIPGRLGRLNVRQTESGLYIVQTYNIQAFSLPVHESVKFVIDDQEIFFHDADEDAELNCDSDGVWIKSAVASPDAIPPGRLQVILSSDGPITIIISEVHEKRELSLALRIAHILQIYHRLDSVIITEQDALTKTRSSSCDGGNIVVVGRPSSLIVKLFLSRREGPIRIVDSVVHVGNRKYGKPGQGIIFTHPHPTRNDSLALFLIYSDFSGLERVARLFPFRTGVAAPDWVVLGERSDDYGAAGVEAAGVWQNDWTISESMTWFSR